MDGHKIQLVTQGSILDTNILEGCVWSTHCVIIIGFRYLITGYSNKTLFADLVNDELIRTVTERLIDDIIRFTDFYLK